MTYLAELPRPTGAIADNVGFISLFGQDMVEKNTFAFDGEVGKKNYKEDESRKAAGIRDIQADENGDIGKDVKKGLFFASRHLYDATRLSSLFPDLFERTAGKPSQEKR